MLKPQSGATVLVQRDKFELNNPNLETALKECEHTGDQEQVNIVRHSALMESERNYKELADNICDMFFCMDTGLKCTYWNKASEMFTGISATEALGKNMRDILPEIEFMKQIHDACQSVIDTGHLHFSTIASQSGNNLDYEVSINLIENELVVSVITAF